MRIYSQADEEKIRAQARVREWHRSGFLDASQAAQITTELRVDLRRTNVFLRAVLFLFTAVVITAGVALIATVAHVGADAFDAAICVVAAVICFATAEFLIKNFRFYRFGIEEAFALAPAVLLSVATALVAPRAGDFQFGAGLAVASLGFLATHLRYGYVYSAIAAMICAAAVPLPLVRSTEVMRLLASLVCTFTFGIVRKARQTRGDEFPGDDYGIIQASAWAGMYLALNLQLPPDRYYTQDLLYWATYALTWVLPIIGFWLAVRSKDRPLMNVSVLLALITLVTNKPYLHLMRQPWDPILLGVLLIASAIFMKRWLANGANGHRRGFTAVRLLASDRQAMAFLSNASTALQPQVPAAPARAAEPNFGGGRSGGAGASGSF
jgi:hypothetical protein